MNQTPLITTAALTSIVGALITLLVAFGVPVTEAQVTAILGFVAVVAPWVVAYVGHNTTTPLSNPTSKDGEKLVRESGNPTPPSRSIS